MLVLLCFCMYQPCHSIISTHSNFPAKVAGYTTAQAVCRQTVRRKGLGSIESKYMWDF
jgi:hypothetical protein